MMGGLQDLERDPIPSLQDDGWAPGFGKRPDTLFTG